MQKSRPVVPGRAARRVGARIDNAADVFESQDVLLVAPERIFDFGLVEHGVDTAQPVGVAVGHCVQAAKRVVEIGQRVAVGPAALRFPCGQDRKIDSPFGLVAAAEMQRQQFRDLFGAAAVQFLQRLPDRGMVGAALALEQAAISGFLSQSMTKGIDSTLGLDPLVDEFETAKLAQLVIERSAVRPQRCKQT